MPKKKLTKSMATKKLTTAYRMIYDLTIDKMGHPTSNVSMSMTKLLDLQKQLKNAIVRTAK